jgi:hypothetical protein
MPEPEKSDQYLVGVIASLDDFADWVEDSLRDYYHDNGFLEVLHYCEEDVEALKKIEDLKNYCHGIIQTKAEAPGAPSQGLCGYAPHLGPNDE